METTLRASISGLSATELQLPHGGSGIVSVFLPLYLDIPFRGSRKDWAELLNSEDWDPPYVAAKFNLQTRRLTQTSARRAHQTYADAHRHKRYLSLRVWENLQTTWAMSYINLVYGVDLTSRQTTA